MEYTQAMLAELVGYSTRRLQQIDKTLDAENKLFIYKQKGGLDPKAFIENWIKYQIEKQMNEENKPKLVLEQVKAEHEKLKMEKTSIDIRQRKGELLEASDVVQIWSEIVIAMRNGLLNLGSALAPKLATETRPEVIKNKIDAEIRRRLEEISEAELPSYTNIDLEEEQDETD